MPTRTPESLPRLLTAAEVAAATGLTKARLYELCRDCDFPAIRLGRSLRFDIEAVSEWLRRGGTAGGKFEPTTSGIAPRGGMDE